MRYKRRDGSFSAHGDQDAEGSLWLTVLTLKAFRDAAQFHSNGEKGHRSGGGEVQDGCGGGFLDGHALGRCSGIRCVFGCLSIMFYVLLATK